MSGPVVVATGLMGPLMTNPQGGGNFVNMVEMETDDLGVVEEILDGPGRFYMNVHTTANRGGHIRSQLLPRASSLISDHNGALQAKLDEVNDLLGRVASRLGLVP